MIVKTKSHKRAAFRQVLKYMVHNKDRLYDQHKRSFAVTHNLKGKSIEKWVKQFEENETHRKVKRKDNVKLTHEILSWHKADAKHITLEKLEAMTREYIQLRNPKGMYVAVPHFDRDHYHVHIMASGIEYKSGKSMWMYKSELQKLKVDIQRFQEEKFPELSKSVVPHDSKQKSMETEAEYQVKRRTGRETEKDKVSAVLKTCYKKADSRETFYKLLGECGLKTYERGGKTYGVVSEDRKFRFNTLGYTEERLVYLDRTSSRKNELQEFRLGKSAEPSRDVQQEREAEDVVEQKAASPNDDQSNETTDPKTRLGDMDELRQEAQDQDPTMQR